MDLNAYDYVLPEKRIALKPAVPRDASKLFVYDTATNSIVFDRFYNLDKYLGADSFLVLNNTKVLPARVIMKKETRLMARQAGGKAVILFLPPVIISSSGEGSMISALTDRKIGLGQKIFFESGDFIKVMGQKEGIFDLKFNFAKEKLYRLLKKYGSMPVPLYLRKTPLKQNQLVKKYQTIFARYEGSSAAPTASLHFTDRVFRKLKEKGLRKYFVTLHVGLGTFAPLTKNNLRTKKLHEEYFEVEKSVLRSIQKAKKEGKKLVAVGTTVVRTLESYASSERSEHARTITNKTDLFIYPPYKFKMVDYLITNFHLPKSSLMMLVEAFLEHKKSKRSLIDLYKIAIKNGFRLYSFGDAMLIL